MKLSKTFAALSLMLGLGAPLSSAVIASEPFKSSVIANYIRNARTPEDHEYIAAFFDAQAVTAQSMADRYADQFECQHSKATEFQKYRPRFAGVTAQRHCREMLRHYITEVRDSQALADYHRNVADY